ncbi:unnamed protein product [Prorocentrum cordatum]|uniref:Uncharacterized protein n=1 Tax=Prorocentrum cordatum TaxID=2364126 RepID=A0ABN9VFA3_9DINO|nr:unnamed protein product [Polarella glacialis]
MNTAKEADAGAVFLRRMLNMNPTYGSYLSGDQEIAGIVQLFAKRFRAKIMQAEAPIQPATLYEPLCEVVWRVIGHVLHSIVDLEDVENSPFPREAVGQVKMLLQTNVELSKKFNEMRRAYLRELSEHRDRQRELSQKQKDLLHDLKEEPIMFYEPLEFVLDEATKDFVREVVEERVKLGFRASAAKKMAGGENEVQDLDVEELQAALKQALNDAKQLRIAHAKEMDKSKRSEDALRRAKDEMELERRKTEGVRLQLEEAQKEILDLKDEIETLSKGLQNKEGADKKAKLSAELADTQRRSLNEALEKLSLAEERIAQLEQDKKDLALELAKAKYRIEQLEGNSDSNNKDKALAEKEAEAARQLRERISSLEKENKQLREQLQSLSAKLCKPKPEEAPAPAPIVAGPSEDDLKEAVAKAAKEYELKIKALQTEIKRLKEELESMNSGGDGQRAKDMEKIAALKLEVEELKAKLQEKDDKYNDLAEEHERLQEHVKRLMAKLEELGAKDFVEEMKDQINLNPLEGRNRRKKLNAFDRLYHDAQRRILDMRAKAKSAARSEEVSLVEAVKLVKDKAALRQAEALRMLQAHHSQTRNSPLPRRPPEVHLAARPGRRGRGWRRGGGGHGRGGRHGRGRRQPEDRRLAVSEAVKKEGAGDGRESVRARRGHPARP